MWAAISYTGKTVLVHIPGNLTAQRYCDEILQPHVLPLMQQNGADFNMTMPDPALQELQPHYSRILTLRCFLGRPNLPISIQLSIFGKT